VCVLCVLSQWCVCCVRAVTMCVCCHNVRVLSCACVVKMQRERGDIAHNFVYTQVLAGVVCVVKDVCVVNMVACCKSVGREERVHGGTVHGWRAQCVCVVKM